MSGTALKSKATTLGFSPSISGRICLPLNWAMTNKHVVPLPNDSRSL